MHDERVNELAEVIQRHRDIIFFGGAGVSTESGIPDFRSSSGLYAAHGGGEHPPEYMLSHSCFADQPEAFFEFYRRHMIFAGAKPNAAHIALARLEAAGRLRAVVTQNIDGLHQQAGSRLVLELHGSVHRNDCQRCRARYGLDLMLGTTGIPCCPACGGVVKPDVVLYEEPLDHEVMDAAVSHISSAEVLIVGGTSLNVYPAAGLVRHYRGRSLVLINRSETPYDGLASLVIRDSIGRVLQEACASLGLDR